MSKYLKEFQINHDSENVTDDTNDDGVDEGGKELCYCVGPNITPGCKLKQHLVMKNKGGVEKCKFCDVFICKTCQITDTNMCLPYYSQDALSEYKTTTENGNQNEKILHLVTVKGSPNETGI